MASRETNDTTQTMIVKLEDGTEAYRPYFIQRSARDENGASDQPAHVRVPIAYPGEEALPIPGGWLIRRLRK